MSMSELSKMVHERRLQVSSEEVNTFLKGGVGSGVKGHTTAKKPRSLNRVHSLIEIADKALKGEHENKDNIQRAKDNAWNAANAGDQNGLDEAAHELKSALDGGEVKSRRARISEMKNTNYDVGTHLKEVKGIGSQSTAKEIHNAFGPLDRIGRGMIDAGHKDLGQKIKDLAQDAAHTYPKDSPEKVSATGKAISEALNNAQESLQSMGKTAPHITSVDNLADQLRGAVDIKHIKNVSNSLDKESQKMISSGNDQLKAQGMKLKKEADKLKALEGKSPAELKKASTKSARTLSGVVKSLKSGQSTDSGKKSSGKKDPEKKKGKSDDEKKAARRERSKKRKEAKKSDKSNKAQEKLDKAKEREQIAQAELDKGSTNRIRVTQLNNEVAAARAEQAAAKKELGSSDKKGKTDDQKAKRKARRDARKAKKKEDEGGKK